MIKHIVMWKLKEELTGKEREHAAQTAKQKLEALKALVPQIVHIEAGINFNTSGVANDLVLYSEFQTKEDLDAYQVNPHHKEAGAYINSIVSARAVCDYEV